MGFDLFTMDVTSILLGTFICCVLSLVIYFISAFGTKEKSFEEALEEQKKRSLEEELQQKQEKGRKDKEKKFKKWNKRKEKIDSLESEKVEIPVHDTQTNELVGEIEIVEPREILQRRKVKTSTKGNSTKLDSSPLEETDPLENLAKPSGDAKVVSIEKRKTDKLPVKEKHVTKVDVKEKETSKVKGSEPQILAAVNDEVTQIIPEVSPVTPSKKKKKEVSDKATDLTGFTVNRLLQFLKEAELGDEESQMLIDVLLNKQKDASEWKKKNDPLAAVKKQLQEKEQAFEVEQSQRQAATAKLKELKQEYAQEKTRASTQERLLQDKVNQQSQENKVQKQRIKQLQEQFNVEKAGYQEQIHQLQSSFDEKCETVIILQEEKAELQKAVAKLESSVLSKTSVGDYETKLENLQKSRDELQKVHSLLVDQHTLLISSHKTEVEKLNVQLTEAKRVVNEANDRQRPLIEELEMLRKSCENLEASKCTLEQQLNIGRSDKRELENLQIQLEEAQGKYRSLEAQVFCLSDRVAELTKQNSSQLSQLQYLQQENERLSVELKSTLTSDVKNIAHQNGDINEKENELLQKSIAEKEVILEEKEKQLQQIHEELQKQKKQVTSLTHDLEVQKQKNNELREKNWKAMDALSNAEKSAEQRIQDVQRVASEKVLNVQQELEKQSRQVAEKNVLEKSCEELKQKVQVAERNLLCYQDEAKEKLHVCQAELEEKIKHLTFELKRTEDLLKLAENRISNSEKTIEGHRSDHSETQEATKKCLQRIFPDVNVDNSLPYDVWLSQLEEQALAMLEASSAQSSQVNELLKKMADIENEKGDLFKAVQHYKTVLAGTECLLNRLQHSAESAELVWKEKLNMKEQELISAIREKENLISEKENLQSSIDQMGRLDEDSPQNIGKQMTHIYIQKVMPDVLNEMQEKLKLLQNAIESSENERAHLQLKYEEVNNNYVNLQDLIENKEQKILELQRNLVVLEDTQKEFKEVKSKLEKEAKINKDLSAQTVKLNSLVKIGQDSLKAEQELVSKLRSELEAHKNCPTTANGSASPSSAIAENESCSKSSEKLKKSKKLDSSFKK